MELTPEIVRKYNKLYKEVATYYGLEDKVLQSMQRDALCYIVIQQLGYLNADTRPSLVLEYLKVEYPYLAGFYKIFHQDEFQISKKDLSYINDCVKAIRAKKCKAYANF